MKSQNAIYAQSGGVTSVINATASAVLEASRKSKKINKLYAGARMESLGYSMKN